ncbi:Yip1 family protein [Alkaliphilus serpentinus]|uniref:Yip1 domain-containing protein n=1 Tax=Alkaliphilus serpentinus TaxID=1482731 RepID=A0A833HSH7_9FIRM|nr:Yip1 family protein [Alkaliphilus serpentinus]KAB3533445.1 hypothetical protein F8153_00585 [Alkaliphilus serpentinus]
MSENQQMNQSEELQEGEVSEERENIEDVILEDEEKLTLGQKLIYFFSEPSKTMKDLSIRPIIYPIFIISLLYVMMFVPKMGLIIEEQKVAMEEIYAQQGITEIPDFVMTTMYIGGFIGAFIAPIATWFFTSVIVYIIALITKAKGRFKGILAITAFSSIIILLGEGIRTIITLITGSTIVHTSLISLIGILNLEIESTSIVYLLLSKIEVFSLLYLFYVAIGLTYVFKISMKKASLISLGYLVVTTIFSLALRLI